MSQATKRDYYEVLGIGRGASNDEIKKAYRRLAKQYHPDVSTDPEATSKFKEINEAYQVLSDSEKRSRYDQFGHTAQNMNSGFDFGGEAFDFSSFFGGFSDFFGQKSQHSQEKQHLYYVINLTFAEAMHGTTKKFDLEIEHLCSQCQGSGANTPQDVQTCNQCSGQGYTRNHNSLFGALFNQQRICSQCKGTGSKITRRCSDCRGKQVYKERETISLEIPKGVNTGQHMRVAKKGKIDLQTRKQGDISFEFKIAKSPIFKREENDLFTDVPISYLDVLLRKDIVVPTIDGEKIVEIKEDVHNDQIMRLRGFGAHDPNNSKKRGDQYIRLKIMFPKKITGKERELLTKILIDNKYNPNDDFIINLKKKNII